MSLACCAAELRRWEVAGLSLPARVSLPWREAVARATLSLVVRPSIANHQQPCLVA